VSLEDFENLALTVPGVTKAKAVAEFWSSVMVYLLGPDGNPVGDRISDDVVRTLHRNALAGVSVSVGEPTAVEVNLGSDGSPILIEAWPTVGNDVAHFNAEKELRALLSYADVELGGKLTVSMLYRALMNADGVRFVTIPLMARADAVQTGTADIQFQPWEFPKVGEIVISTSGGIG
jgi:uncharacterized phage protein gp47/JayE